MRKMALVFTAVFAIAFGACGGGSVSKIMGGGATFPKELYDAMFAKYKQLKGIEVNYQAIGSGAGQKGIASKTLEFGASDNPYNDEQTKKFMDEHNGVELIHIPTCVGAIAMAYNLKSHGFNKQNQLKITPEVIAGIFLGTITKWNDPAIAALNPDAKLPDLSIIVVHRNDSSGTTYAFTDYLANASPKWFETMGKGTKDVDWKTGKGAQGNQGIAAEIDQTDGSIGYLELSFAENGGFTYAAVQNKSGNFIVPSIEGVSVSADFDIPAHTRVSIANTAAANGYPIASFTWVLLYKEQKYDSRTLDQAKALVDLIWWMTHDGQSLATPLYYAPLAPSVVAKLEALLLSVTYDGKPVMTK
ncbi:MAG: phosphate ABC transporter substrate-binding protein PstS [Spirochaetes bacterium GWF1_51_8]|nr:MAG: phosphate ABC transporter substrate-binding protein PstS [Spirochaetes bacterium GWF1_51_8]